MSAVIEKNEPRRRHEICAFEKSEHEQTTHTFNHDGRGNHPHGKLTSTGKVGRPADQTPATEGIRVCIYVCMCMYVCMYVYICVSESVRGRERERECVCVCAL